MNRPRTLIARERNGLPRTFRLGAPTRATAYRRLAAAILGLDVASLAVELRSARRALASTTVHLAHAA